LTAGVDDTEYTNFVARYREIVKQSFSKECIPAKHCEANMWLVKPANLNQGIVFFLRIEGYMHSFIIE